MFIHVDQHAVRKTKILLNEYVFWFDYNFQQLNVLIQVLASFRVGIHIHWTHSIQTSSTSS